MFKPCGLCHWILLDKIHPGESCQSKGQRSQQELRDAVLQPLLHLSVPVCSPQKMRPTEGVGWHWGAPGHPSSQSRAPTLLLCPGDSIQCSCCPPLPVVLQHPTSPSLDEWSITRILLLILLLRKYSNEIYVNTLHSFYGWENKGRESCSGLITPEINADLLIPIPLTLENPRSIKSSPNHRAILHSIHFQSCLKSSRSYLLSESCCIFFISTLPHQEKPIEKYTFAHKKLI